MIELFVRQRFVELVRERGELIVGLGELLYFDEAYGAAADVFGPVLARLDTLTPDARERVVLEAVVALVTVDSMAMLGPMVRLRCGTDGTLCPD